LRRRKRNVVLLGRVEGVGPALLFDCRFYQEGRLLSLRAFVEGHSEWRNEFEFFGFCVDFCVVCSVDFCVIRIFDFDVVTGEAVTQVVEGEEGVVEVDCFDLKKIKNIEKMFFIMYLIKTCFKIPSSTNLTLEASLT
jgi:hypothetical protein